MKYMYSVILLALLFFAGIAACSAADNVTSDNATSDLVIDENNSTSNITVNCTPDGDYQIMNISASNVTFSDKYNPGAIIIIDGMKYMRYGSYDPEMNSSTFIINVPGLLPGEHDLELYDINHDTDPNCDWTLSCKFVVE